MNRRGKLARSVAALPSINETGKRITTWPALSSKTLAGFAAAAAVDGEAHLHTASSSCWLLACRVVGDVVSKAGLLRGACPLPLMMPHGLLSRSNKKFEVSSWATEHQPKLKDEVRSCPPVRSLKFGVRKSCEMRTTIASVILVIKTWFHT
jgi:hypothetical protein